jgi:hypothetical protein
MLLSTKLFSVSGAAMASFIPQFRMNTQRRLRSCNVPFDDTAPTASRLLRIKLAQEIFCKAASTVKWYEDDQMLEKLGWMGANVQFTITPPFRVAEEREWDDSNYLDEDGEEVANERGTVRRPLGEYRIRVQICGCNLRIATWNRRSPLRQFPGRSYHDA